MLDNLRYFIDGRKLLVKWNWSGVDNNIWGTCSLKKRINDQTICEEKVNLTQYEQNKGGCVFDMPDVPAYIELTDTQTMDINGGFLHLKKTIWEAEPYRIEVDEKGSFETVRHGLFGKRNVYYKNFTIRFPNTISEAEIDQNVDGWMIAGSLDERPFNPFFLPKPRKRETNVGKFKVTEEQYNKHSVFKIVDEIRYTKYNRMFAVNQTGVVQHASHLASLNEIAFDKLGTRREDGYYETKCPYCFERIEFDKPVFRAKVGANENVGYLAQEDKPYEIWCRKREFQTLTRRIGHVLRWESDEIRSIRYLSMPEVYVPYKKGDKLSDIVVGVVDAKGNETTEKLCPYCHNTLPSAICKYPCVFISMMGDTGSGKTVYMASMLHQLETKALLPGYKFNCIPCTNRSLKEIQSIYETRLAGHADAAQLELPRESARMSPTRTVFPGETGGFGFTSVQDAPQEGLRPITDVGGFLADEGDNGAFPLLEPLGSSTAEPEPLAESDDYDFNPTDVDMDEPEEATPGEKLPQATARQYSEPYIYQLSSEDNANRQAPGVILAFFDFPGEAIRRSPSSEITAYDQYLDSMIKNADGLIFMFDPSTLEMVKGLGDSDKAVFTSKTLPGGEAQWSFTIRQTPEMILRDFQNSYFPNSKLNKPVAFVLSKADAVRDYLIRMKGIDEKEVSFLEEGVYALDSGRTGVYETELREASERILEFLNERGLSDQYKRLLNNEDDGVWMCVSSTGLAPDSNGTLYQMHGVPVHVIDPVEWILYRKSVNSRS